MFNSAPLTPGPVRPDHRADRSYQAAVVIVLILTLLMAGGSHNAGSAALPTSWLNAPATARADSPAPAYSLYAWGYNSYGQLGNGTTNDSPIPIAVSLPAGVTATAIAVGAGGGFGGFHSLAIGSDGKLYAWGDNSHGQLGNSTTTQSNTPVVVNLPARVRPVQVAAGGFHSLAIGSDGNLYTWGDNSRGQLGNGTYTDVPNPIPIAVSLPAGVTATAIAAGFQYSLAIGSDSKIYTWGWNEYGQLGNGTTNPSSVPVVVSLPARVRPVQVGAGLYHSLVIGSDGNLYTWGWNGWGQLGNGTTTDSSSPVAVILPPGVTPSQVAAGFGHSLTIGSDGKLYAWGLNNFGQLGNGTTSGPNATPIPVAINLPAGVRPTRISAGWRHSLASGSDGKLYAWGDNTYGELGIGPTSYNPIPTPVVVGSVVAGVANPLVAAGDEYSLAVLDIPSQIAVTGGNNQSASVGTALTAPLVATVRDNANNPVSSVTVTFIAPVSGASGAFAGGSPVYTGTTDASGIVTATFTANTLPGSYSVMATVSGVSTPATFSLTNTVGAPAIIRAANGSGQNTAVTTSFANPLVVTVTDQYNNPLSDTLVTFNPPSTGPSAAFQQGVVTATTGTNGQATSSLFVANTIAGSYSVTATVSGVFTPASFSLTNTPGAPATISASSGGGQSAAITTFFANPLVVTVTDQYNNPLSGTQVTFNPPVSGPSTTFFQRTATTGANGQATSSAFFANTVAGSYTVTATASGIITPVIFPLTNTAGPPSALMVVSGDNQQIVISTTFGSPLVAKVTDNQGNAVGGAEVDFAAPTSGPSATFAGSPTYTATTDATGLITTTTPAANSFVGSYIVTATVILPTRSRARAGMVRPRATAVQYHLTNLAACNPLLVTSSGDDGSCGTLRAALVAASAGPTKTVSIQLTAGSTITLTTGLTLTNRVAITTTAPCGIGAGNTLLPPVTIRGTGTSSGVGLTLAGNNQLYGLWVRGFSGIQIKAPVGSSTKMQCVRTSKL